MMNFKNIMNETEQSTKQLLFFYELTKMGVVRFDLSNSDHAKVLERFVNVLADYNEEDYKDDPLYVQMERKNRVDLYRAIVIQVLANSISGFKEGR